MVAYADLILPDTTYLERHDCISLLDRPICEAEAAADAIRWPVVEPDRDVRGFQSVLCDLGGRLGLPGFVNADGTTKYKDYADYIQNHERKPGVGPLAGWRGNGDEHGRGAGEPEPDREIYREWQLLDQPHPRRGRVLQALEQAAYQDWAVNLGIYDAPTPYLFTLWSEPLRRFQLAAEGKHRRKPPEHLKARIAATMDPLPIWYPPFSDADEGYDVHALTQRPMAMYHSWGSQNAWLRQIHGRNPLYVPTKIWEANGFSRMATGPRSRRPMARSPYRSCIWPR